MSEPGAGGPVWPRVTLLCTAQIVGMVGAAEPGRGGATMAMHSFMGFAGGFLGPLVFGLTLDHAGCADAPLAWGLAFVTIGVAAALGPVALLVLGREAETGGRSSAPL